MTTTKTYEDLTHGDIAVMEFFSDNSTIRAEFLGDYQWRVISDTNPTHLVGRTMSMGCSDWDEFEVEA